jgi:hypothetical protein
VKYHVDLHCKLKATDAHHCLFKRNDSKRHPEFGRWIDSLEWNFQPTCPICNWQTHAADRVENRRWWFEIVLAEYGIEQMKVDMEAAPEKLKLHNPQWKEVWGWLLDAEQRETLPEELTDISYFETEGWLQQRELVAEGEGE